jgi:murein DD-endopeptidase MepM/ murein hydrolase activator NlpD
VQEKIRNIRAVQVKQRTKLTQSQQALQQAQGYLRHATQKLSQTRSTLAVVRDQYQAAIRRHLVQKKRMEARVLAQYEAGNPSYLEVVLDATNFADFTERAEMTETIAERDSRLLQELVAAQRELARQKAQLQEKANEEAEARAAVLRERNEVAIKTELTMSRLKDANAARAQAEKELAEFQQASNEIAAMMSRVQRAGPSAGSYAGTWSGSFLCPVSGAHISCPFGWRIHPITHRRAFHEGTDLACPGGTPIHAADKGRVVLAGWYGPYGQAIIIDHGSGVSTLYGHTMRGTLRVHAGEVVQRGQVLAEVDSTGWSTGNHLHFGKYVNGRAVPPF